MVVLYFLTATLVLLFGNGFRLQRSPLRLVRTGNLLITFVPKEAGVFVDDALADTSAPVRVRAIFPGEHRIRIEATGYIPYTHLVRVEPMQTTFISDVYLLEQHDAVRGPTLTQAPEPQKNVEGAMDALVQDARVAVSSTPYGGTIITRNDTPLTRDLGIGTWRIAGGDTDYLFLSKLDTNETQFRSWNSPDDIAFRVGGTHLLAQSWNNVTLVKVSVVYSPFEVWLVNTAQHAATLLSRVSKPIVTVLPIPNTAVALVVLPDEIIAYQLADTLNTPTTITRVPSGEEIVTASVSADRTTLSFITKKGGVYTQWSQLLFSK